MLFAADGLTKTLGFKVKIVIPWIKYIYESGQGNLIYIACMGEINSYNL